MKGFRKAAGFVASGGAALCGRPVRPAFCFAAFLLLTAQAPPADLATRELRLEIKQAEDRVGTRVEEIQRRVENLERKEDLLLLFFGVTLAGIGPAYWLLIRKSKKLVDEKLGSLIESRPRALLALIDEREASLRRRRETTILVIAESLKTEGLLRGSGFAKVTTRKPGEKEIADQITSGFIVVLNLEDGCSEETASDLINTNDLEYFLLYTSDRSNLRGKSATYANSPVTLFARLMELIEYKDALERESRRA